MEFIRQFLIVISRRQDIFLVILLLVAIFMMIIPLPTGLIDFLIALNLMISILLMMMAIYIKSPLEFSTFPAVLLITTLYRLSLTISTTRLILLQADAGDIIDTFGKFAVGGNLGVGLIVFMIITIVQFIVITKGSERVAEVSARFSLDAMPGKQMSIDGDLRAGTIDADEARRLRGLVQKESQLFGAMDGAMKFVKGDAIAGIIIILVNILGGTAVGVMVHDMSASTAFSTYAILSIGDGLISQIPALLISITAGIIVTRISGEEKNNLAGDLVMQISKQSQAVVLTCAILLVFGFLPGFPTVYFFILSAIVFAISFFTKKRTATEQDEYINSDLSGSSANQTISPGSTPLIIRMAKDCCNKNILASQIDIFRFQKFEQIGIPLPEINLQVDNNLPSGSLKILLYQEVVLDIILPKGLMLADISSPDITQAKQRDKLSFGGNQSLQWVSPDNKDVLSAMNITLYQDEATIIHCLSIVVDRNAKEFIGVQETRFLMDAMEGKYADLVKEIQRQLPIGRIADILQRLVLENISIRDLRTIFESLIEWSPREKDPVMITEYVRIGLRRHIIARHSIGQPWISGWVIGDNIENHIREAIRQTASGSYSSLEPNFSERLIEKIKEVTQNNYQTQNVLITTIDVRRFLRKVIEREFYGLKVLSFQEIGEDAELRIIGNIDLIGEHE
ncbi:EscV/YscV/HrcV family type III secretion system export apparatus protein [Providencia rettgeri]|uniref:EscV/YscV/HrcV family type III secretion system export apparatus protein n=4 Tax=Enterobacterales TaxID=91347 RepID=A0AA42JZU4_9GAMM|nr:MULTISPECIES: EscV/YscV/HrcV family type III secretion system export apparatus protein [Providencia]APC09819.1 Secretion system apparatus protein SsaV [Providencia rettgeri]AVL73480.1 EscV/YscV/HrcV family type III secretion system export apparatus protein [Providencia rettgeri]EIL1984416.1 EscV/YscV/HrcV family type III secretion system export apparatus protein [Providencia rettgeri]EIU7557793.1 EscV/YscV/HrcV family type III secretion system export apparatus protein [Providencia rettgeri]